MIPYKQLFLADTVIQEIFYQSFLAISVTFHCTMNSYCLDPVNIEMRQMAFNICNFFSLLVNLEKKKIIKNKGSALT